MNLKPFNENGRQVVTKVALSDDALTTGDDILHGDVVVRAVKPLKNFKNMKKVQDNCLAYGEHTGHVHMLTEGEFDVREDVDGTRYFEVTTTATLKHQEHSPIVLPAGFYKTGFQLEYDPFLNEINKVRD